jgi:hypothetical protein
LLEGELEPSTPTARRAALAVARIIHTGAPMYFRALLITASLAAVSAVALCAVQEGGEAAWAPPKPTPQHALLKQMAGKWDATFKLGDFPGAPPVTSTGSETCTLAMNGLWLLSDYQDPNYEGGAFQGHGVMGYDPDKKKYVSTWVDSTDMHISVTEGDYDEATKTLTMLSDGRDRMTGKPTKERAITRFKDADTMSCSFRSTSEGSKEMEIFSIEYKRKK